MAANISAPFHNLDNDELYDALQSDLNTNFNENSNNAFHNSVAQSMNSLNNNLASVSDPNDSTYQHAPSFYYTESQVASKHLTNSIDDFLMLHCNIRSANKNFDSLRSLLLNSKLNCSVIGLSETWFTSDTELSLFSLPGYNLITNNRTEKNRWRYMPVYFSTV